jgi:hypothetical protein
LGDAYPALKRWTNRYRAYGAGVTPRQTRNAAPKWLRKSRISVQQHVAILLAQPELTLETSCLTTDNQQLLSDNRQLTTDNL